MAEHQSSRIERTCEACGVSFAFQAKPSGMGKGWGRFCSKSCSMRHQRSQRPPIPLAERFKQYLGAIAESGCIPWVGGKNKAGYGRIGVGGREAGVMLAHRVAYKLAFGPIPEGLLVCHHCDNPACVNPAHLFLGTDADNTADCVAKNRNVKGERCQKNKLTEPTVILIRNRYASGDATQLQLANEYGIAQTLVSQVVRRLVWKHV